MRQARTGDEAAAEHDRTEDRGLAERLLRDEPALLSSLDFGPFVRQGEAPGRSLLIGDQSSIELFTPERSLRRDYHMSLIARPGDAVAIRQRDRGFEAYLAEALGLAPLTFIEAGTRDPTPVAEQCRTSPALLRALGAALPPDEGLTIKAYFTTGHVWRLAQALGQARGSPVHVAGPGPRISRRANDKLWFWALARDIAGQNAVPPTVHAFGPAAAAGHVARLARLHDSLVVKVPGSAGGAGNIRIESDMLRGMNLRDIRALLLRRLAAVGWAGSYPVLVGVWESGVIQSPSAQLWIPPSAEGAPRLVGLFEQSVQGEKGVFAGARPARLEARFAERMSAQSGRIATVLQRLGYYGACSLDAVIRETGGGRRELHWIECNGRWSGVSIPLAGARSLLGGAAPGGLVILQEIIPGGTRLDTAALRDALGDLLFRPGGSGAGIVLTSPPDNPAGTALNFMAIAGSQERAEALAARARERVAGLV